MKQAVINAAKADEQIDHNEQEIILSRIRLRHPEQMDERIDLKSFSRVIHLRKE